MWNCVLGKRSCKLNFTTQKEKKKIVIQNRVMRFMWGITQNFKVWAEHAKLNNSTFSCWSYNLLSLNGSDCWKLAHSQLNANLKCEDEGSFWHGWENFIQWIAYENVSFSLPISTHSGSLNSNVKSFAAPISRWYLLTFTFASLMCQNTHKESRRKVIKSHDRKWNFLF